MLQMGTQGKRAHDGDSAAKNTSPGSAGKRFPMLEPWYAKQWHPITQEMNMGQDGRTSSSEQARYDGIR